MMPHPYAGNSLNRLDLVALTRSNAKWLKYQEMSCLPFVYHTQNPVHHYV